MKTLKELFLDEKILQFNSGAKYGNIIILAGGAGSGKGYAKDKFLRGENYKIFDVDEMKKAFLKMAKFKSKYKELRDLELSNPDDVFKLHMFVKKLGVKDAKLNTILKSVAGARYKPNLLFDVTLKEESDIREIIPKLVETGYDPKNINLVWILSNYKIAIVRNRERERVVPEDILIQTHAGAKSTMVGLMKGEIGTRWLNTKNINGEVWAILNNNEETLFWGDSKGKKVDFSKASKTKNQTEIQEAGSAWTPKKSFGQVVPAGFTAVQMKKKGKPISKEKDIVNKLFMWIKHNAPK